MKKAGEMKTLRGKTREKSDQEVNSGPIKGKESVSKEKFFVFLDVKGDWDSHPEFIKRKKLHNNSL